jgi:hypothetical protein
VDKWVKVVVIIGIVGCMIDLLRKDYQMAAMKGFTTIMIVLVYIADIVENLTNR